MMKKCIFACVLIGVMLLGITACGSLPDLSDLLDAIDQGGEATPPTQNAGGSDSGQPTDRTPANDPDTDSGGNNDTQGGGSQGGVSVDNDALNPNTRVQTMGNREVFVSDEMEDIITEYILAISQSNLERAFACIYFEDATFLSVDDLRASVLTTDLNEIFGNRIIDIEVSRSTGTEVRRCEVRVVFEDESVVRVSVDSVLTSDFVWMVTKPEIYHANWEIRVPADVDVFLNGNPLPMKDRFIVGGRPVHIIPCMTKRVSEVTFVSSVFGRFSEEFTPVQARDRFSYAPEISDQLFEEAAEAVKDLLESLYAHMVNRDDLSAVAYLFAFDTDMSAFANMYADGVNRRNRLNNFVVSNVIKRRDYTCFVVTDNTIALNMGLELSWMDGNRSRSNRLHTWILLAKEDGQWFISDIHDRALVNVNTNTRDW
jgi:hypothetical protein